jgi:F-type H+-transporting ATPase subunit a
MGLEFLVRVRRATLIAGGVAALMIASYAPLPLAAGFALGAIWSLANLALLEQLVVALTGADRGKLPAIRRAAWAVLGFGALFAAGAVMLAKLPVMALLAGFLLPHAVLVLKALSLLLLPTRAWRWITRDPRIALLALAALVGAAWLSLAPLSRAATRSAAVQASGTHASEAPIATPAPHPAEPAPPESGPPKFPSVITVLHRAFPNAPPVEFLEHYEVLVFSFLVAAMLCFVAWLATRNPRLIPGPLQNGVEAVVEGLNDFILGILGPRQGPRFVPLLGTLFVYILAMNLIGLIPFMESPTSSLNVTVALALTVFVYVQYIGIRELGPLGYLDHMAGNPRDLTGWILVPLMLPIHLMGELAKPISLSARLFGNVFGEDMLLVAFATLGVTVLSSLHVPFGLPLHAIFYPLALLSSVLQALVFTVLSTIYILLMLPHDDHEHPESKDEVLVHSPV